MTLRIEPFTDDLIPAIKELNCRLTAGGASPEFRFPENPSPEWLPKSGDTRIYQEYFVALQGGTARGGYVFKQQDFSFRGQIRGVSLWHWPISEGMVNKAYAAVALQMLRHVLKEHPLTYGLGMGAGPLPTMLRALGWKTCLVPFYFKVSRPRRFFEEIRALRRNALHRVLMDLAASTGICGLALRAYQGARMKGAALDVRAERVESFGGWADALWEECQDKYEMTAVRKSDTLNALYGVGSTRFLCDKVATFLCYKVTRRGTVLGWVVLLDTPMHDDQYFGNLRVGSIVDCLAIPQNASLVIRAATRVLEERGVDVIVSNQAHVAWSRALENAGCIAGPSNFCFAASKELTRLLHPFEDTWPLIHVNRGDGSGPTHL